MSKRLPTKWLADVTLGKMVQPEARSDFDVAAPYLRAAHVQPDGKLIDLPEQPMWFSHTELRQLDLRAGDIVVVEGGAGYGRSAVLRADLPDWGFQNSIIRLRPRPGLCNGRFLDYALQSALANGEIDLVTSTATIPHFTAEKLSRFEIPAPDVDDQRRIADFLDNETAQIDTLIAEQERFIELLRERRSTVAGHVVWAGLDAAARRSSTGIDTTPDAPDHWLRLRNKNVFREVVDLSSDGVGELLTVSHITGVTPRSMKNVTMFEAETLEGYKSVLPGDLAINTMWAWMGALGVSEYAGLASPAYGVYRSLPGVPYEPRYFDNLFRTPAYIVEMTRNSRGITSSRLRLYPDSFLRLPVIVPPLAEQRRIADHLDAQTGRIDALIAEAERNIALSKERRAALITAAVTGQVNVSTGRAA